MMNNITITHAQTKNDLEQILALQKSNLPHQLTPEQTQAEGFVTVQHDLKLLESMNQKFSHVIAKSDEQVIAYALVMLKEFESFIDVLKPLFSQIDQLTYQQSELKDADYFVMGQICIAKDFRSKGVFKMLYDYMKEQMQGDFDFIITDIDSRNKRSIKAHQNVGFELVKSFTDSGVEWQVVILPI